jgi:hypothetical protein
MVAKHLNRKVIGGASLLYEWKGRNPQLKPGSIKLPSYVLAAVLPL